MKTAILICVLSSCLALFELYKTQILELDNKRQRVNTSWQHALVLTKEKLEKEIQAVTTDPTLSFALGNNKIKSARQFLSTHITPGTITSAGVFSQKCLPIAMTARKDPPSIKCPRTFSHSYENTHIQYGSGNRPPQLTVWQTLSNQAGSYYIFGEVILDHSWLDQYPELKRYFKTYDLNFRSSAPTHQYPVSKETPLFLNSKKFSKDSFQSNFLGPKYLSYFTVFLMALIGICALVQVFSTLSKNNNHQQTLNQLLLFIQSIKGSEKGQVVLPEVLDQSNQSSSEINTIKREITHIIEGFSKTIRDIREEKSIYQERSTILTKELEEADYELAKIPFYHSLAQQIEDHTGIIQKTVSENSSRLEDISDIIHKGLAHELQKLQDLANSWKEGCHQMTPRKFLRTLSERPVGKHSNQLEEQLKFMHFICHASLNMTINLSLQTKKTIQKNQRIESIVSHWNQLASPNEHTEPANLVSESIRNTLGLLPDDHIPPKIEGLANLTASINHLNIPTYMFEAMLFHLFQYFFAINQASKKSTTLSTKILDREPHQFLVIKLEAQGPYKQPLGAKIKHHWDLGLKIARSLPLEVMDLPSVDQVPAAAIRWQKRKSRSNIKHDRPESTL